MNGNQIVTRASYFSVHCKRTRKKKRSLWRSLWTIRYVNTGTNSISCLLM